MNNIRSERQSILAKMHEVCPPGPNRRAHLNHEQIFAEYIRVTTEAIKRAIGQSDSELLKLGILELDCAGIELKHKYRFKNSLTGKQDRWLYWLREYYPLYETIRKAKYKEDKRTRVRPYLEKIMTELTEYLRPESAQQKFEENIKPLLDRYQSGDDSALSEITTVPINLRGLANARAYYLSIMLKAETPEDQIRLYSYVQACDQVRATCEASAVYALGNSEARDASGYYSEMFVKIKQSDFGRQYHLGISPQTLPKDIRRACVAPCWQYDVQASVFSFYLYLNTLLAKMSLSTDMPYIQVLCEDRKMFRQRLVADCLGMVQVSPEYKMDMVKRALTALGFGARITGADCWTQPGSTSDQPIYGESALKSIILHPGARELFRNHELVQGISSEIQALGKIIKNHYEQIVGEPAPVEFLNTRGYIKPSKALSYLYQNFETAFMRDLIETCEIPESDIILSVHDAIYLRHQIGNQDLLIQFQKKYFNIFKIQRERLEAYADKNSHIESDFHHNEIQLEELRAKLHHSQVLAEISGSQHDIPSYTHMLREYQKYQEQNFLSMIH